jgi:hypothetical protein
MLDSLKTKENKKGNMSIKESENLQRKRKNATALIGARRSVIDNKPVLYKVSDFTGLGGDHGVQAIHDPSENKIILELPQSPEHVVMVLHALEAVLFVIMKAMEKGFAMALPVLDFIIYGELAKQITKEHFVAETDLRVNVLPTHYVVVNKQLNSRNMTIQDIAEKYYAELKRSMSYSKMLSSFPPNTIIANLKDSGLQPGKQNVHMEYVEDRNTLNPNPYSFFPPARISSMEVNGSRIVVEGEHETV